LQAANFGNAANSLQDNPASVLDATDLVFVDAADTGFGHSYGVAAKDFRSLDADSEAMSQVVLNWLRTHGRMSAPTYLLGESYGSLRVIAMARDLARSEPKVRVDGLVLAGFAITFAQNGRVPNPLFVAARLPMMASVAWHYGKIDNVHQTWEQAVGKARNFVRDEYAGALMWGHRLDSRTWERIVGALPDIIGIPASYFKEHGTLAVDDFNSELLRDGGLILDRNDGLQALPPSRTPPPPEDDADLGKHFSAFQTNMESYARDELRAVGLGAYAPVRIPPKTEKSWDFETAGAPALDVTLATLLQDDPKMRVLVLQGRYDTLTDLGSTEYVLGQTNIAPDRYHIAYYDGGHMLRPEAEALDSLRAFMRSAAKPGDPKHAADN
jgi:carboxypeptidase C (cathepsin A)